MRKVISLGSASVLLGLPYGTVNEGGAWGFPNFMIDGHASQWQENEQHFRDCSVQAVAVYCGRAGTSPCFMTLIQVLITNIFLIFVILDT